MTIYLLQWTDIEGENVNIRRARAFTSMVEAKKTYANLKIQFKTHKDAMDLMPPNDAITKHNPKTQAEVIELINSLV